MFCLSSPCPFASHPRTKSCGGLQLCGHSGAGQNSKPRLGDIGTLVGNQDGELGTSGKLRLSSDMIAGRPYRSLYSIAFSILRP